MQIQPLPQDAVRRLNSSQAIKGPCCVVKELVDNAIDAGATQIKILISANTLDMIQVTDNGRGIPQGSRDLVALRHHTSKIEQFSDLEELGGSSLGFRGEALASIVDLSGKALEITTRVAGDSVGVKFVIQCSKKAFSKSRASHPIGKTVRVNNLLALLPVRKKVALKCTEKNRSNIVDLIRSYAIARKCVGFRLRWVGAKDSKHDLNLAPRGTEIDLKEAATLVFGHRVRLECQQVQWPGEFKSDGQPYEDRLRIDALFYKPSPTDDLSPTLTNERYLAVDGRPLSSISHTSKKLLRLFRKATSAASNEARQNVSASCFLILQIFCPKGSYDVNVEPAKDDVCFVNQDLLEDAAVSLFHRFVSEACAAPPASLSGSQDDQAPSQLGRVTDAALERLDTAGKRHTDQQVASTPQTLSPPSAPIAGNYFPATPDTPCITSTIHNLAGNHQERVNRKATARPHQALSFQYLLPTPDPSPHRSPLRDVSPTHGETNFEHDSHDFAIHKEAGSKSSRDDQSTPLDDWITGRSIRPTLTSELSETEPLASSVGPRFLTLADIPDAGAQGRTRLTSCISPRRRSGVSRISPLGLTAPHGEHDSSLCPSSPQAFAKGMPPFSPGTRALPSPAPKQAVTPWRSAWHLRDDIDSNIREVSEQQRCGQEDLQCFDTTYKRDKGYSKATMPAENVSASSNMDIRTFMSEQVTTSHASNGDAASSLLCDELELPPPKCLCLQVTLDAGQQDIEWMARYLGPLQTDLEIEAKPGAGQPSVFNDIPSHVLEDWHTAALQRLQEQLLGSDAEFVKM